MSNPTCGPVLLLCVLRKRKTKDMSARFDFINRGALQCCRLGLFVLLWCKGYIQNCDAGPRGLLCFLLLGTCACLWPCCYLRRLLVHEDCLSCFRIFCNGIRL